ncbi:outer membrane lipoprotein-sorting protein [Paraburkholderia xenovorans]|uniref:outer membrane lipoprotein-sorting protein n=1 Tax=Paraburkholderia xenovorans TaxID=36873 RepID=UPI0038B85C7E
MKRSAFRPADSRPADSRSDESFVTDSRRAAVSQQPFMQRLKTDPETRRHTLRAGASGIALALAIASILTQKAGHAAEQSSATPDAAVMLARADAFRSTADDAKTDIDITNIDNGQSGDDTHYLVYTRGDGDTLALTKSGENEGQKYLATTRGHWFYVPNTRSAVRINGMQRLQGEVVISDITRTHWADSYRATIAPTPGPVANGHATTELDLTATDQDNVYPKIKLWVTSDTQAPVRAQFFLASGLLFRSAEFSAPVAVNGRPVIKRITYHNEVEKQRASVVEIVDGQPHKIPSGWFNPDTLADGN